MADFSAFALNLGNTDYVFKYTGLLAYLDATIDAIEGSLVDASADAAAAAASAASAAASVVASGLNVTASLANANAAAASIAAVKWTNITWNVGQQAWSPINGQVYRRLTNGSGASDPSADPTNWLRTAYPSMTINAVTGTTVTMENQNLYALTNPALSTATGPAAGVAGDVLVISVCNGLYTNVFARNGLKIMGLYSDYLMSSGPGSYEFAYINAALGWWLIASPAGVFPGYVNQALGIL